MNISRRSFLKLLLGTAASVSLFGCRTFKFDSKKAETPLKGNPDKNLWKREVRAAMNRHPLDSLVPIEIPKSHPKFPGGINRFGMSIDLNLCDGCGECALACMLENNVPRVNAEEASLGRYMHWLEIRGNVPVMCAQCGDAPCEKVCPTGAAVASPDGFSAMVYPRCVGTRFCGANCPIHARKFNYTDAEKQGLAYKFNPEVPLREKGVMEKCSFCIQRLQDDRLNAKTLGKDWRGTGLKTACAEACPKGAIVFGNWLDEDSPLVKSVRGRTVYALSPVAWLSPSVVYLLGKG
ncbi:MAG: 4Fe-4S dicluster domain-containing protein [Fibrobacteraceae bacterium]|nr:4Fe-4S dicluster domain-containing protein [Fibrobacteraceae bacterium]